MTLDLHYTRVSAFDEGKNAVHLVVPPRPIQRCIYRCGPTYAIEHVKSLYADPDVFGLLYVSGNMYAITSIHLTGQDQLHFQVHASRRVKLQKRQRKGGQSAQRIGRLRDEMHHNYVTQILERLTAATQTVTMEGLVVAGPPIKKRDVVKRWQGDVPVIGVVTVPDNLSFEQLKPYVLPHLLAHRYKDEIAVLDTLMAALQQTDHKVCYGQKDVKRALARRQLKRLIVHQDILDAKKVDLQGLQRFCNTQRTELVVIRVRDAQAQMWIDGFGGYAGERWY